jgi:hypothetical protein
MNGMGNLRATRGEHREAIGDYEVATSLGPDYAYAWHDMFLSYVALADGGEVDLAAMHRALAKTKETGRGRPSLDPNHIARLESILARIERTNSGNQGYGNDSR